MSERRDTRMCADCPSELTCPDYVSGGTCSHGRRAKEPVQPKRDIAADRKEFDRVCLTPDWPSYADFVGEALPHYLTRCEEAEAALEAVAVNLASRNICPPDGREGPCEWDPVKCADHWRSWLDQQGKEAKKA